MVKWIAGIGGYGYGLLLGIKGDKIVIAELGADWWKNKCEDTLIELQWTGDISNYECTPSASDLEKYDHTLTEHVKIDNRVKRVLEALKEPTDTWMCSPNKVEEEVMKQNSGKIPENLREFLEMYKKVWKMRCENEYEYDLAMYEMIHY